MKKITFKLDKSTIQSLIELFARIRNSDTGNPLVNLWMNEMATEIMLRLVKYRNRPNNKKISVQFNITELMAIDLAADTLFESTEIPPNILALKVSFVDSINANLLPKISVN